LIRSVCPLEGGRFLTDSDCCCSFTLFLLLFCSLFQVESDRWCEEIAHLPLLLLGQRLTLEPPNRDTPGPRSPCIVSTFASLNYHRVRFRLRSQNRFLDPYPFRTSIRLAVVQSKWLLARASPLAKSARLACRPLAARRTDRTVRRADSQATTVTERVVQPCRRPALPALHAR